MRRAEILRSRSVFVLRWLRPKTNRPCSCDPLGSPACSPSGFAARGSGRQAALDILADKWDIVSVGSDARENAVSMRTLRASRGGGVRPARPVGSQVFSFKAWRAKCNKNHPPWCERVRRAGGACRTPNWPCQSPFIPRGNATENRSRGGSFRKDRATSPQNKSSCQGCRRPLKTTRNRCCRYSTVRPRRCCGSPGPERAHLGLFTFGSNHWRHP